MSPEASGDPLEISIIHGLSIIDVSVSICCMAKRTGSETLAVNVYEQLRSAILNRALAPGERLKPVELAVQFGVSLGVMREATSLLAAQNLVRLDRNRGCHVTSLSLAALANLTVARQLNEGAALRLSVQHGGVGWESQVLAAHHRMATRPMFLPEDPTTRNEEWALAHLAFHSALIDNCGNPILLDICARLSDAAELYRAWSSTGTQELHRDVAGEHQGLLDAALAHDADHAVALFQAHLARTQQILVNTNFNPGPGEADRSTVNAG